jgi:3-oxoacyl-[acyl-carrier protein] reductase
MEKKIERVLVTGAARGIGLSIATRLAKEGFFVILSDVDADALADATSELKQRDLNVVSCAFDCRDRAAVQACLEQFSPIDILVNNAAMADSLKPFLELSRDEIEKLLSINLHGSFVCAQETARQMHEGGRIVNIASRGYLGGAGAAHYVASKAALVGLTRSMATELRWKNINVNAVAPGMVDTRLLEFFTKGTMDQLATLEPSGAAMNPNTIADIVAFLISPDAASMSGQVLLADGGKTMGVPIY